MIKFSLRTTSFIILLSIFLILVIPHLFISKDAYAVIIPAPTPNPLLQGVDNQQTGYESYRLRGEEDGFTMSGRIDDGYGTYDPLSSWYSLINRVGIIHQQTQRMVAEVPANISGGLYPDFENLLIDQSQSGNKIFIDSTTEGGVSSLPNVLGNSSLFLRYSSFVNPQLITDPVYYNRSWGNFLAVDDNNIAMIFFDDTRKSEQLFIWRNPDNFHVDDADVMMNVSENYSNVFSITGHSIKAIGNNKFFIAYYIREILGGGVIIGKVVDNYGNIITPDFIIKNSSYLMYTVAVSDVFNGKVMVTYDSRRDLENNPADVTIARLYNIDGTPASDEFQVNNFTSGVYPDVDVLENGNYVFTFCDWSNDVAYYRIWDPNTESFTSDQVLLDVYDEDDYSSYDFLRVKADDKGGFAVLTAGYYDGESYNERLYFHIFDENENQVFNTNEGVVVSVDDYAEWDWYSFGLDYKDDYYYISWASHGSGNESGIAFRKVSFDGVKEDVVILDQLYGNTEYFSEVDIVVDENSVPVVAYRVPRFNLSYWSPITNYTNYSALFGLKTPIPKENPNRVGICPNAQSLSDVNENCSGLVYKVIGDTGLNYNNMGNRDIRLLDVNSGGAFLDLPPAIAFNNFNENQIVGNSITVNWIDTKEDAGGDITFYVDIDNKDFNGTILPGVYSAASLIDSATLNISSIPNGNYYLYAVIDDGYYDEYKTYSLYSFEKNVSVSTTPTVTVTPTNNNLVYISPTITITPTKEPLELDLTVYEDRDNNTIELKWNITNNEEYKCSISIVDSKGEIVYKKEDILCSESFKLSQEELNKLEKGESYKALLVVKDNNTGEVLGEDTVSFKYNGQEILVTPSVIEIEKVEELEEGINLTWLLMLIIIGIIGVGVYIKNKS